MSTSKLTISDKPHIVIRASAGSGKTYQLSTRYLDLLYRHAEPQTILATTFTRKAAGEILERILRRLALAATVESEQIALAKALTPEDGMTLAPLSRARSQQMLVSLCRSLHRASVSTIDSFFHRIASSFRYELKLPPDPKLVDSNDALAVRLRTQAIEAMLSDEDLDLLIDLLKRLHHDQTGRSITQALDDIVSQLYDTYRVTEQHHWQQLDAPAPLPLDAVSELVNQLGSLLATATTKPLVNAIEQGRDSAMHSDWLAFLKKGLPAKILADPMNPMFNRKAIDADLLSVFVPLIEHAKATLLTYVARQTQATYDLLHRFDAHYIRLRQQQRLLLYSDLPYKLAHELPKRDDALLTEICYRLDGSVSHLLLDEFQDTSFDQWRVLGLFAEEVTAHSDGSRTFFCVGDVKQAIYGWRGGRAELFNQIPAQLNLTADAQVTLDVSFRSSQTVLDAVNLVFNSVPSSPAWTTGESDREEASKWAKDFRAHEAQQKKLQGHVQFITTPAIVKANDDGNHADTSSEFVPEGESDSLPAVYESFVADHIANLHRARPQQSIGVLVTTNKAAVPLLSRLRELGVDASAEGRSHLTDDPAVEVILSALRLADHPGHTAAAFHVLNSPLASIIGLRSMRTRDTASTALAIRSQMLAHSFATIVGQWIQKLAPSCSTTSARKLLQLVELADRYEIDATARLGPFIDAVEHADFEEPSSSPVRVMTIHKSKGLEFDIVVLPQLGKKMGQITSNDGVTILRDPDTDEVQAIYRGTNKDVRSLSTSLEAAYEQERMRRLRDDLCMLYVAMTRAKQALHLIAEPVRATKNGLSTRGLRDQSFASLLRHALCDEPDSEDPAGNQMLYEHGNANWHASAKVATPTPVKTAAPADKLSDQRKATGTAPLPEVPRSRRIVSPSSLHQQAHRSIEDILALHTSEGQSRGTLFHRWLEQIQWLGDKQFIPSDDQLMNVARSVVPARKDSDAWIAQQINTFRATLDQPNVQRAFSPPSIKSGQTIELWRERNFAVHLGDDLLRGTFDRVVIIREKQRPVRAQLIDFKTDQIHTESAKQLRADHYRPQIDAYRDALSVMLGLPARQITASLLFLHDGQQVQM